MCLISRQSPDAAGSGNRWWSMRGCLCGLLLMLLISPCALAQELSKPSAEVLADLASARKLSQNLEDSERREKLNVLVRKLAPHFPLVPVVDGLGETNHFFKVELNRHKTGFDGVRFKVPPGPIRSFACVMAIPKDDKPMSWFYTAVDGEILGSVFMDASEGYFPDISYFGTIYDRFVAWGKDGDDYITITQYGLGLKGGAEYVLWFACDKEAAFPFQGAIKLTSAKPGTFTFESIMGFTDH